jgi:hypothetical protein
MTSQKNEFAVPKKDALTKEIYSHFRKKFGLGELGIVESVCVASMLLDNQKSFSIIVISPSGHLKSSILADVVQMFPSNTVVIPSRNTPYGLSRDFGVSKLKDRTWINNDMVRTFTGIGKTKIEEIVGFYAEMMSEGQSGSATAFSSMFKDCRMNMIGNIALNSYRDVKDKFITSTFAERILQLSYLMDKNVIRHKTDKKLPLCNQLRNIVLGHKNIVLSKKQKENVYEISDALSKIAHYEEHSMRPDEIVESFICAYALLNGRDKVVNSDFDVFIKLMPFFRRVV